MSQHGMTERRRHDTIPNMNRTTQLDINPQFKAALAKIESGANVFIGGKAGTGKSTLLEYFRGITKKNVAVLAPTGVAAVNIRGQTIHSFFGFKPDVTMEKVLKNRKPPKNAKLYQKLDCLVIDEISMVRADLLDCVDAFLRMHGRERGAPFGGIQIVVFGDLYQLPPIVTRDEEGAFSSLYQSPYFFDAFSFAGLQAVFIELDTIYRQEDRHFIEILHAVRTHTLTDSLLQSLNTRVMPDFEPDHEDVYVHLVTTNAQATDLNSAQIRRLPSALHTYTGHKSGNFDQKSLPAPLELQLKVGAQVMLTNNDPEKRWVNGTVGVVTTIDSGIHGDDVIWVKLETGARVSVLPNTWEMYRFSYNDRSSRIVSETSGTYTQYPLLLAWAITIHKSQGKTFQKCVVDLGRGTFAHGQAYVALSRCVSLDGLILTNPVAAHHVLLDTRVVDFLNEFSRL